MSLVARLYARYLIWKARFTQKEIERLTRIVIKKHGELKRLIEKLEELTSKMEKRR